MPPLDISQLTLEHLTLCPCTFIRGGLIALDTSCLVHVPSSLPAGQERLEELRKVEALEQLHLIVAAFGEPLVIRWVKSVAAMQSGTGL